MLIFTSEKRLAEERAELARRKKEKEEAHLYITIGVLREESFRAHHSFDLTSVDLPAGDPALPTQYRVLKTKNMGEFLGQLAEEKGLDPSHMRFWVMVNRQNKTTRPDQVIRDHDMTVEEADNKFRNGGNPLRLWLEVGHPLPDGTISWPDGNSMLVFLKNFDVLTQTLTGIGSVYVRKSQRVNELAPSILERMDWPDGTELLLFEVWFQFFPVSHEQVVLTLAQEIKHNMVDPMKPKLTFQQSEIQDGDIICFQRVLKESE
jgi:ubiquitin carboxyl-terminal hydrolase 7